MNVSTLDIHFQQFQSERKLHFKNGTPLNEILYCLFQEIETLNQYVSLSDCSGLAQLLKISPSCDDQLSLCYYFTALSKLVTTPIPAPGPGTGTVPPPTTPAPVDSFKVSVSSEDKEPGFLNAKLGCIQNGNLFIENNKMLISGTVPLGTIAFISKKRISDFNSDGTGKNVGDLNGWALADGRNGTQDLMDYHLRTVSKTGVSDAGKPIGSDKLKLAPSNIPKVSLTSSTPGGTISVGEVQVEIPMQAYQVFTADLSSTSAQLYGPRTTDQTSVIKSVKHGHAFNQSLTGGEENPTEINLIPKSILVIPIERIK